MVGGPLRRWRRRGHAVLVPADLLPIRTERLTLRLHTESDLDALHAYYSDPDVVRYLLTHPWTEESGRRTVAKLVERKGLETPARALALVVEHEGEVVGDVALWSTDETGAVGEIGWAFHPSAAGRGLATEAAAAVLDVAFGHYGMHRVSAQLDPRNTASARLCERLGMHREALHRQSWWSKGEWTDTEVFAALASDRPRDVGDAIVVSAVDLRDAEGSLLTVRKRGTDSFMHPGGKPEAGETPAHCAVREVEEELGLVLDPTRLELVAVHRTAAANEAGRPLVASVFRHPALQGQVQPDVTPAAEIEEIRWLDPTQPLPEDAAPLLSLVVDEAARTEEEQR